MKQVLLILLVLISFQGFSQNFVFGKLEVAQYDLQPDFSFEVKWYGAKKACEELGDGWRLPTLDEFKFLYKNDFHKIADLKIYNYWTSTEISAEIKGEDYVYVFVSRTGETYDYYKKYDLQRIRPVRDFILPQGFSQATIETVKIDGLKVMKTDLGRMNWYQAKEACEKLGAGWRLPTVKEFELIFKKGDKKGELNNLKGSLYWTSTEFNDDSAYHFGCTSVDICVGYPGRYSKYGVYNVRAVRDLK